MATFHVDRHIATRSHPPAAAGNLRQALGSFSTGSLFALALHPAARFALVTLFGAAAACALWGTARDDKIGSHAGSRT